MNIDCLAGVALASLMLALLLYAAFEAGRGAEIDRQQRRLAKGVAE